MITNREEQTEMAVNALKLNESVYADVINDETAEVSETEVNDMLDSMEVIQDVSNNISKKIRNRGKKTISQMADEIVAAYLADRSDANWKALMEFFWYGLKQFSFKFVNNWDDAYDMTITTFTRALEAIDSYDPNKSKFSTWLWTICKNNCIYYKKQKARMKIVDNDISDIYDSELLTCAAPASDLNTKEYCVTGENNTMYEMSYDTILDELYNVALTEMSHIGGTAGKILEMKLKNKKKIREIAKEMNMNESTVKNYLYKGKENLARILEYNHKSLYNMYNEARLEKEEGLTAY